ncbi:MAG TPA: alpha/beta hydrolase [Allosphingosinicella sp.]|nr:alpha/beta hydrolase [Allosphingosinicella sp.]
MLRYFAFLLFVFAAVPAAAQSAFTSERISVTVVGTGPDVVLIPGLTSSPEVWASTVAAMPGYRYHLIHVSGFAGRPAGANAAGPVLAPVADEIARYISEQRLSRPALIGHSLGGSWAMMVAGRHPELVSRVMVVDMMPFMAAMFGGPGVTADSIRPMAEQMRQRMAAPLGEPERRQQAERTIATMVRTESLRAGPVQQSVTSDTNVVAQAMYDLITTDLRPDVARISVPFMVLWVLPPNAPVSQEQMTAFYAASYAGAPQAVVRQIPESYHFIMFDQPEAFQRELRAFLQGS